MTGATPRQIVQMFIDGGRPVTAMLEAARWGELEMLQELLASGIPVDATDEDGGTALMNACSGGQARIVDFLIRQGADVNLKQCKSGETPLMWCLLGLHPEKVYLRIVETLLKAGADVQVSNAEGWTPLALARHRKSDKLVKLLESARDD